ncbi:hypothetical protein [Methylocystis sp. JR02]|uniref:hypothetical protein n=1 Tax=Methylocystis sp. JR02 TaxID=3046284 RepID=UPI0024BA1783|nr:hypothetical protein [Methylocystis sp. JR02]MDJ0447354.1 hypothetical protein [Methylocystis sp. JR02]
MIEAGKEQTPKVQSTLDICERLLKFLNGVLVTLLFGAGVVFLIVEFPTLKSSFNDLLGRINQVQSVEFVNLKVVFGAPDVLGSLAIYKTLEKDDREKAATLKLDLRELRPEWFARLLNVGAQTKLCDFERATDEMQESRFIDKQLERMAFVTLSASPEDKAAVLRDMATAKAEKKEWTIGAPRSCYRATLTGRGWNIRTAIVEYLTIGLTTAASPSQTPGRGRNLTIATD